MPPKDQEYADDRPAVETCRTDGSAPVLVLCEHASNRFPPAFGPLGISADVAQSHIAWDPGALAVARGLSARLDAALVASTVSRLVYDCNRPPEAPGAMPEKSEVFEVPGNRNLSPAARAARVEGVYRPFQRTVVERLAAQPRPEALVTIHSFTPVYMGQDRATEIGVLHDLDARLGDAMLATAAGHTGLRVERNRPYGPEDGVTHSLREYAQPAGLPNVMLEIRNDLIATPDQQQAMAEMLAHWLTEALAALEIDAGAGAPRSQRSEGGACQNLS